MKDKNLKYFKDTDTIQIPVKDYIYYKKCLHKYLNIKDTLQEFFNKSNKTDIFCYQYTKYTNNPDKDAIYIKPVNIDDLDNKINKMFCELCYYENLVNEYNKLPWYKKMFKKLKKVNEFKHKQQTA